MGEVARRLPGDVELRVSAAGFAAAEVALVGKHWLMMELWNQWEAMAADDRTIDDDRSYG